MTTSAKDNKRKTTTETLSCELSDDEMRDRGEQLARVLDDIVAEEGRHEALKTEMKSAMAALEAKRDALGAVIRRKAEHRLVEVEELTDYRVGKFTKTRLDSGVVIFERPLTSDERQLAMSLV